jgi:hypothetical protein
VVSAGFVAVAVTAGFALLDLARPAGQRGNIGRFLVNLGDGTGAPAGQRLGENNVVTLVTSPFTLLVGGSALYVGFVLLRHWGGLRRLFGLYPAVRAALAGIGVATVFAGIVEGAALNVLGAAVATAVPPVVLATLRVLRHADDRTGAAAPGAAVPVVATPAVPLGDVAVTLPGCDADNHDDTPTSADAPGR